MQKFSNLLSSRSYETIERQYSRGQISRETHRQLVKKALDANLMALFRPGPWEEAGWLSEADTASYEFWQNVLPDEFESLRERFIRLQHEPLGENLMLVCSENAHFHLGRVAMFLWQVCRIPSLASGLYEICRLSVDKFPPPEEEGFWYDEHTGSAVRYVYVEQDRPFKLPGTAVSALIAFSMLQLSSMRWADAIKAARWLKQKQRKDGSWDERIFRSNAQRKTVYGSLTELHQSRFVPTCVSAQVIKRSLLDPKGSVAQKVCKWLLRHQEADGSWDFPVSGICEPTTLVLETFDLLRLPTEQSFSSPLVHELEKCAITQLPTKAYWLRMRDALASVVKEGNLTLTLAFIDLGEFGKRVNNRYSHIVGDNVIREFASALADHFGKMGTLVRWGGDEFIIIFNPGIAKPKALQLCQGFDKVWIRRSLPENIDIASRPFIRVGVATYPADVCDAGEKLESHAESRVRALKGKLPLDESQSKLLIDSD